MYSRAAKIFLAGIVVILQMACATPSFLKHEQVQRHPEGLKVGDIIVTSTGEVVSHDALMTELARARIVYVGETHSSLEDHQVQLQILRGLYSRNPSLILALEMFPREVQPLLDEYGKGLISEETFLKEVRWDQIWGYPFALYRGILNWARDRHIRIVGLNAPNEIVRKVAHSGLASLRASERDRVARDFHLDDSKHQAYVRRQYDQHQRDNLSDFNRFFEAQLAWEETMAETLAQILSSSNATEQIVVLIGKGHISDQVGVPELTYERAADPYRTVAPIPINYPGRTADPRIADFVWLTDRPASMHRARLGVKFRPLPSNKGLEILDVLPGGPAAKAGIKKGDILYLLDGKPATNLEEVRRGLGNKLIHELGLRRDNREFSVTVTLSP